MPAVMDVYTGFWRNHSKGFLYGFTITLTSEDGAILLSLIAFIVAIAGQSFWNIVSYIIHQARCQLHREQAAQFYQQQIILKNSGSALSAAWRLGDLSYRWRKRMGIMSWRIVFSTTSAFILTALIVSLGFGLASIFSSQVTTAAGNEVLLRDPRDVNCGQALNVWRSNTKLAAVRSVTDDRMALNYARTCYADQSTPSTACNTYMTPYITSKNRSVACPFAPEACLLSQNAAIELDTGYLGSNKVFGVNSPASGLIEFRNVLTCAPLNISRFAASLNRTTIGDGGVPKTEEVIRFSLGAQKVDKLTTHNWTYDFLTENPRLAYTLRTTSLSSSKFGVSPGWEPIAELNRSDADVAVFFVSANAIKYQFSVSDPVFKATTVVTGSTSLTASNTTLYTTDQLVSGIGCMNQYEVCNPSKIRTTKELRRCTSLGNADDLYRTDLRLNPLQNSTLSLLYAVLNHTDMYNTIRRGGPSSLIAQSTTSLGPDSVFQTWPIPDIQWKVEVKHWFNNSLAAIQQGFVEMAHPRRILTNFDDNDSISQDPPFPETNAGDSVCGRQIVRNISGYQNFSTLGVFLILLISLQLMILGMSIHIIGEAFQQMLFKDRRPKLSWTSDGYLQLQRMAFEGAGYYGWEHCTSDVPIPRTVLAIAGLDVSDTKHPRLIRAAGSFDVNEHSKYEKGVDG